MLYARMGGRRGRSTSVWLRAGAALACAAGVVVAVVASAPPVAANATEWLDPTFGGGTGSAVINGEGLDNFHIDGASDPDSDGRFYVLTQSYDASGLNETERLRRMLSDGTVDPTFGTVVLNTTGFNFWTDHVWVDDVADTVTLLTTGPTGVVLSRFTDTGQPDPAFGTAGQLIILAGTEARTDVSVQRPNGGFVVEADTSTFVGGVFQRQAHLVGVTADGQLDATWGVDGVSATLDFNFSPFLVTRPGGGYLLAADFNPGGGGDPQPTLAGFTETGVLDTSWAASAPNPGMLAIDYFPVKAFSDGPAIVIDGNFEDGVHQNSRLTRLTTNGAPDTTFSGDGVLDFVDVVYTNAVSNGGSYYLLGDDGHTDGSLGLTKVSGSGVVDPSFGTNGTASGPAATCAAATNAFFTASRILVAGHAGCEEARQTTVTRFSLGGTLDTTYGDGGSAFLDRVSGLSVEASNVNHMQPDGRLIAVGVHGDSGTGVVSTVVFRTAGTDPVALAGSFVSLPPQRILDTRNGNGVPAAGAIAGGSSVDLQVTGRGGVPASGVGAVVLNVTVTQPNWDGSVVAYPTGQPKPLASNLNFAANQTIPNLVIVKVGTGGKVTLTNNQIPGKTLHLVADVAGYYLSGTATAPGTYTPLVPARVLDTRNGTGVPAAGAIASGSSVDLQVTGQGGVPASGVGAVVLNVTVTQPNHDGSVVAYPTGQPKPLASNVNFAANQTIPNLVTVKVGAGGKVTLTNNQVPGNTLHLVADVAGYYLAGTATAKGTFVPVTPERVLDTRNGTGLGGTPQPLGSHQDVNLYFGQPHCCGPALVTDQIPHWWVSAVVMNVTVTQPTWDGSLVAYPSGTTPPLASNLNFLMNTTIPNLVIAKLGGDQAVNIRNNATQGTVHVVVDISGYFNS